MNPLGRQDARPLGRRIILYTIVFSSVITLIISVLQLTNEFTDRHSAVKRQLDNLEILLPSISESVWTFNEPQISLALQALTSMPHFQEARIVTPEGRTWLQRNANSSHSISRSFPLERETTTGRVILGTLEVVASIDAIYVAVLTLTAEILFGNAVKTFLVAGFMGWLLHVLVTSRLPPLKREVEAVLEDLGQPPAPDGVSSGDELDSLKDSVSHMAVRLKDAIGSMKMAEAGLQTANEELDARVREKTAELEESKKKAEDAAEAVLRSMGEQRNFLSMVSHEFRGPLSTIAGAAQLIAIYGRGNGELDEELAKINRAMARMSNLINEYLNEERLDSSASPLDAARFDLGALVEESCAADQFSAGSRPLDIRVEKDVFVVGDSNLIGIAISNVIDNALKFSPPDSPVTVTVGRRPGHAELTIRDRGPGIPAGERDKIFEKYYRSIKTDRVCGVGLGLYLVKRIVDMHGGTVAVESPPADHGTAFTLRLPLAAD
ncbi:Signal transduction histidine kinase [Paramagnetospirillum caucaseum]|uniref:histidine kinase n=1 Tax=Paramagnetospirillum caucaseum TaxID=1244869 RepID=M3A6X2_9PROT|nr:ATP-binding protein [Paramagnetospirillum caucaseum]EME68538.1 Signal transduction histidine kinase [Paramagnetospirillum caucaseum]